MNRRAFFLPLLLLASPAPAQEPPAPQPPPAPAEEALTLAYRFPTGRKQRFRGGVKADLAFSPEGQAGAGLGPVPIAMEGLFSYTEKVIGSRAGTGTLAVGIESLQMKMNVMGSEVTFKKQGDRVVVTRNGQPLPPEAQGAAAGLNATIPSKGITIRREATGALVAQGGAALGMGGGSPGAASALLQFPTTPVRVGETWETTQEVQTTIPGPLAAAAATQAVGMRVRHTLKAVETRGGKQVAVIESEGAVEGAGAAAGPVSTQAFTATSRFDVKKGVLLSGHYNISIDLSTGLALPGGAAPGPPGGAPGEAGGAPPGLRISGSVDVKIAEAPPAPAKPAARKRPRTRR